MSKKSWIKRQWEYEKGLTKRQNLPKNKSFNNLYFDKQIEQLRKGDFVYCTVNYAPVFKIFGKVIPSIFSIGHEIKEVKEKQVKVLENTPISRGKKAIWVNKNCISQIAYRG